MTSRVSFYKALIQDLRHRIWMLALSCLASFMALPVFYLLQQQDWERSINNWSKNNIYTFAEMEARRLEYVMNFFAGNILVTCGTVLGAGALIVGIWGFRHVFSKKMIDLYHSVPINRKQLFLVEYLNGFLIWFVPMIVGVGITAVLSLAFLGNVTAWLGILPEIFKTVGCLVLAFLLIYHVVIVAVMLSGNVLNTLVNGTILNFSFIALFGLFEVFADCYFSTYYSFFSKNILEVLWTSPISSAIYQMTMRYEGWNMSVFVMNLVMTVVMFAAGFILYLLRPSELAEQGMKIKWIQVVFKTVVTIIAGLAGWVFFGYLTETDYLAWVIFGAVFAGVLVYGILDIIFQMDFKAFFKHKIQMAVTTLAAVLIGCTFLFDWIGFDGYMPDEEDIAYMGMYVSGVGYSNYNSNAYDGLMSLENRLEHMQYDNTEVIHAFLERMTDRSTGRNMMTPSEGRNTRVTVCVTEKNGRSYYRSYSMWNTDEDVALPIMIDDSYVQVHMQVPDIMIEDIELDPLDSEYNIEIDNGFYTHQILNEDHAKELLRAYNIDIAKEPKLDVYQNKRIFGQLQFRCYADDYFNIYLDLYDSMENVIHVLEKYDYDIVLEEIEPENVESIRVLAYGDGTAENLEGIFGYGEVSDKAQSGKEQFQDVLIKVEDQVYYTEEVETAAVAIEGEYSAMFTDKEDIAKLLNAADMNTAHIQSIFGKNYCACEIRIYFKDSNNVYASMEYGKMPKELLSKFEEGTQWY